MTKADVALQFCLVLAFRQDCGGQMSRLVN